MTQPARKYTIGRALTCDIVLADESVSRIHTEIIFLDDSKFLVSDCGSTQGTFVVRQGVEVRANRGEPVSPSDTLRFGTVSMLVKEIVQAIYLKHPPVAPMPPEGAGLMRCQCGAVKVKNSRCEVCGK